MNISTVSHKLITLGEAGCPSSGRIHCSWWFPQTEHRPGHPWRLRGSSSAGNQCSSDQQVGNPSITDKVNNCVTLIYLVWMFSNSHWSYRKQKQLRELFNCLINNNTQSPILMGVRFCPMHCLSYSISLSHVCEFQIFMFFCIRLTALLW